MIDLITTHSDYILCFLFWTFGFRFWMIFLEHEDTNDYPRWEIGHTIEEWCMKPRPKIVKKGYDPAFGPGSTMITTPELLHQLRSEMMKNILDDSVMKMYTDHARDASVFGMSVMTTSSCPDDKVFIIPKMDFFKPLTRVTP